MLASADMFWQLFEQTGSIAAYIMYKKMVLQ